MRLSKKRIRLASAIMKGLAWHQGTESKHRQSIDVAMRTAVRKRTRSTYRIGVARRLCLFEKEKLGVD